METKKVTYNLPIKTINQIDNLKKRTGESKSKIIADLVEKTMTKEDKVVNSNIANELPQVNLNKSKLRDLAGTIKLRKETDSVKLKNEIYLDKVGF